MCSIAEADISFEEYVVYMFPIEDFIHVVGQSNDGLQFRALKEHVQGILNNFSSPTKLVVGICNVDKVIMKFNKKKQYGQFLFVPVLKTLFKS